MQLTSHQQRIVTALGAMTIPVLGLGVGGWVLFAILFLFCALALWEFYGLFWSKGRYRLRIAGVFCAGLLFLATAARDPLWIGLALMAGFWISGLSFLFRYGTQDEIPAQDAMVFLFGLVYIPVTLHFALFFTPMEIVLVLCAAMASDTAAFYAGSRWGKHKLWPQVSPKKSWEGSIASILACMLIIFALGHSFGNAPWYSWIGLALVINIASQLGDFFESALKRGLGVKDSGKLLPGHGGMLDRVDSLLFAIPVYVLIRELCPSIIINGGFTPLLPPIIGP